MIHLLITTEGTTELLFVKKILAAHLGKHGIYTTPRSVLTSKDNRASKEYRGGLLKYDKAKNDIISWLKERKDRNCYFTTMFDLYALPQDFPGVSEAKKHKDPYLRVKMLEEAFAQDIADDRFIPYIQLHEFEALILADPQRLVCEYMEHDKPIKQLVEMVGTQNPELINDGEETAPSKRIIAKIPEYNKSGGVFVTEEIGLQRLRDRCKHFNEWVSRLEGLINRPKH